MGEIVSKIKSLTRENKTYNRIPQALLNEAMSRISLVDLVGQTVTLAQASKDQWKGLCPLHTEKTPSFFVNETKGFYHCFGCQESGNAISFLMKAQGMDFRQAAMRVLQLAGLEFYDAADWMQGESTIVTNSVDKTVDDKISGENEDVDDRIYELLFYMADIGQGMVKMNPDLFDKMEQIYLMMDENYRFKNYERMEHIHKNIGKILKEIQNDSTEQIE